MRTTEYYVQVFKIKGLKCVPRTIRKNIKYIIIFTSDFKPYHINISLQENLLEDVEKYRWQKIILNIGDPTDDITLNFSWRETKLVLSYNCVPNKRYKIMCNLFNFDYSIFIDQFLF